MNRPHRYSKTVWCFCLLFGGLANVYGALTDPQGRVRTDANTQRSTFAASESDSVTIFRQTQLLQPNKPDVALPEPRIVALHMGLKGNQYKNYYATDGLRDTIVLPSDVLTFNMDFALPDVYRRGYQVAYKIDPLMDRFQPMAASGQITLVGLRPGKYWVHVRLWSSEADVETAGTWLLIKKPAFYETQGFYALVLLIIGGFVSYILLQRAKRIKDETALRKQISRDLHDEVGGLLTGISMRADMLGMQASPSQQAGADAIGQYSREAVQMMDDIIWAIDVRNNDQGNLQERMEYLASQMLEPKGIRVHFDERGDSERKISQIVRQNTYLLFKEILHNILKHAQPEWVAISIHLDAKTLLMEVCNDGVETTPTETVLRKGQGVRNMETRARQMNATITAVQEDGIYSVRLQVKLRRISWLL